MLCTSRAACCFICCARRDALVGDDLEWFVANRVGEESRVGASHLCAYVS